MTKDAGKLKEEMKGEIAKLKEETKQELKSFRETMEREMRAEIRDLKTEQKEIIKSLDNAHDEIRDLKKALSEAAAKNKQLEKMNEALRAKCSFTDTKVQGIDNRLVQSEQYSRRSNLEIQGVVRKEHESVTSILAKIGSAISEPINETDIEICHRVPTRDAQKTNIVVQFRSRAKRDNVLTKAKNRRLTNNDLDLNSPAAVYVNEHLCPTLKRLLAMCVKKKYECNWKSVWTSNGKIFARQYDGATKVQISSERDVERVFVAGRGSQLFEQSPEEGNGQARPLPGASSPEGRANSSADNV